MAKHKIATGQDSLFSAGKFYVYLYRDPRPSKKRQPIYVGKGTASGARAEKHWFDGARCNPLFASILKKIAASGLAPIIERVAYCENEETAFGWERALIKKIGRRDKGLGPLCNLTDGGDGPIGRRCPDAVKAKISAANKGRVHTLEARAKIAEAKKGRVLTEQHLAKLRAYTPTPETRAKLSEANIGKTHTVETRAKISDTLKKFVITPETRSKMSASLKGRIVTPETREKISESLIGSTHTPAARAKISKALKGRIFTEEHRAKISESKRGHITSKETREKISKSHKALKRQPRPVARRPSVVIESPVDDNIIGGAEPVSGHHSYSFQAG